MTVPPTRPLAGCCVIAAAITAGALLRRHADAQAAEPDRS
ncbi:MAG: hypothetical protein ACJA2F_000516 [Nitriliruptoraceae bacterium]|jgi:hypothetical protein